MGKQDNIEWNQQRVQAMAWLRQSFPCIFSLDVKPLKIGITQDILATHLNGAPDEVWIRRAIGYHVRSHFYLKRIKQGAYRFNLEGQPDGEVTDVEAASAKEMLIACQKKYAQKAAQIKMERNAAKELAQAAALMKDVSEETHTLAAPDIGTKKILTLKKKATFVLQDQQGI